MNKTFLTIAFIVTAMHSFNALAGGDNCGVNCSWTISNGKLKVWATDPNLPGEIGDFTHYQNSNKAPWSGSNNITSIEVTGNITKVGSEAFYGVNGNGINGKSTIKSITLPDTITTIGNRGLYGLSSIESLTLPSSLTTIGDEAFYNIRVPELTIPPSVNTIGNGAFSSMASVSTLVIPEGVETIGTQTLANMSNLTSLTLPSTLKTIGNEAFYWSKSLETLVIPEGVTSIGYGAFKNMKGLRNLTIPDSVTSLGNIASIYDTDRLQITNLTIGSENLKRFLCESCSWDAGPNYAFAYEGDININCFDGVENCQRVLDEYVSKLSYTPSWYSRIILNVAQKNEQGNSAGGQSNALNPDGSYNIYDADGNIIGYRGKRIYTVEEATKLSKPTGNTFRLRYK